MQSKQGVNSQCSGMKTVRLRTFLRTAHANIFFDFSENVGFVSTVQDLMKKKKRWVGVEYVAVCRSNCKFERNSSIRLI